MWDDYRKMCIGGQAKSNINAAVLIILGLGALISIIITIYCCMVYKMTRNREKVLEQTL